MNSILETRMTDSARLCGGVIHEDFSAGAEALTKPKTAFCPRYNAQVLGSKDVRMQIGWPGG